ncbi:hypothetical protein SSCG_03596 [Streptomyces clavuligerus]|nr:hypothetical protein SSCG_03596 [Streptomyces clavuligerus]
MFELPAPKAGPHRERAARREGAEVHGFRLWWCLYPATGREGYVPVVFVVHWAVGWMVAQREGPDAEPGAGRPPLVRRCPVSGWGEGVAVVD